MGWGATIADAVAKAASNTAEAAKAAYQMAKELAVRGIQATKNATIKAGASAAEWALDQPLVQKIAREMAPKKPKPQDPYHEVEVQRCAVQRCKGNLKAAKALRRQERKRKIASAKQRASQLPVQEQKKLLDSANRLEQDMDVVERANLCNHVYEDASTNPAPIGHNVVSDKELRKLGVDQDMLKSDDGFKAQIYKTDKDIFGEEKYVVVFKGTEFSNTNDWKQNVRQGAGKESSYYSQAMKLSEKLARKKVPFEVAGHSLGGGLAAAAAQVSGMPATTFNAAGLNEATVPRYSASTPPLGAEQVQAYRVKGELVTGLQEKYLSWLLPKAPGHEQPHDLVPVDPKQGPIDRHGMTTVIDSIEQQKRQDEGALGGSS